MKYIALIWWVLRNRKALLKVKDEGLDVYEAIKVAVADKKVTKAEYKVILDEIVEFVESLRLGGK